MKVLGIVGRKDSGKTHLVVRLVGDFTDQFPVRQLGALLNVVALPLFGAVRTAL